MAVWPSGWRGAACVQTLREGRQHVGARVLWSVLAQMQANSGRRIKGRKRGRTTAEKLPQRHPSGAKDYDAQSRRRTQADSDGQQPVRTVTPPRERKPVLLPLSEKTPVTGFVPEQSQRRVPSEQQGLLEPPELPRGKVGSVRSPRTVSRDAAERIPDVRPSNETRASNQVDEGEDLFRSLEKKRDEEVRHKTLRRIWGHTFNPLSREKRVWDSFILLLVVFVTLYQPYSAAFRPQHIEMDWWEWVVDM